MKNLASILATLMVAFFLSSAHAQTLPVVHIVAVYPNANSVKIDFSPVPGAKDYCVFEASNPKDRKYSGSWHWDADGAGQWSSLVFPMDANGNLVYDLAKPWPYVVPIPGPQGSPAHHVDLPALEIEWNNLQPGTPTKLVVQALDGLGPEPPANLYDANNNPMYPPDATMSSGADGDMAGGGGMAAILGSNGGATPDGNISTNGQAVLNGGPNPNAHPSVIAQSAPFVVTATGKQVVPSVSGATQSFISVFGNPGVFTVPANVNLVAGSQSQVLTEPAGKFDILYSNADILHSTWFTMNRHGMAALFDGETPGTNQPLHVAHGVLALSPQRTANFSRGRILHVTMEVDAHSNSRRWPGIDVSPANDPLTNWYPGNGDSINKSNTGVFFYIMGAVTTFDEDVGFLPGGDINDIPVVGAAGQAPVLGYRPLVNYQYGHGLDDRSRFDLFMSTTHIAAYEDGQPLYNCDLPTTLPFDTAKVYFSGYLYHSALGQVELQQSAPYETYWIDVFPFSMEWHFNSCGFEVLPAGTPWNALGALVQIPQAVAPK